MMLKAIYLSIYLVPTAMTTLTQQNQQPQPSREQRGEYKTARIPVKVTTINDPLPRKPQWLRVRASTSPEVQRIKGLLRQHRLHSVCEEASCPNLPECFSNGTATFMVMGDLCTRRCPFCDVAHGRPQPLAADEPRSLATVVAALGLRYVVITSVNRDDLRDGGGAHFAACIDALRDQAPTVQVEILVPDFRNREAQALEPLIRSAPNVFNHNIETVPRLYRKARPGASYQGSLSLLKYFADRCPSVPTKSGLMVGLGETFDEVVATLHDLRAHDCNMLTIGQYLQPSRFHLAVSRFWHPKEFDQLATIAQDLGFSNVAAGPLVRSSYHADQQARHRSVVSV